MHVRVWYQIRLDLCRCVRQSECQPIWETRLKRGPDVCISQSTEDVLTSASTVTRSGHLVSLRTVTFAKVSRLLVVAQRTLRLRQRTCHHRRSCMTKKGMAMRRKLLVPTASPTLGAVGKLESSHSICFDSRASIRRSATRAFTRSSFVLSCRSFSSAFVVAHHSVVELLFKVLSRFGLEALLYSVELPRLPPFCLGGAALPPRAFASVPSIHASRLGSCSRAPGAPGAPGLRPCLWP